MSHYMDWSNIKMKKVAIMTWYQHKNYGTTLQAFALQRIIENLGYSVEGIDYYSKGYYRETFLEKILSKNRLKEGLRNKINRVKYGTVLDDEKDRRYQKFIEDFIAFHTPTQTSSQLFCLNDEFDAFVCGSDQIWSPNEFNSKYFLDFVKDDIKKVSYAPSFGVNHIENDCVRENIGELVSKIPHLSVRESRGSEMLKEYYGVDAKVVIDPTLLLNAKEWLSYSNKEYKVDSNILLCYFLGENENVWKEVERIAKLRNLQVAVIPVFSKDYRRKYKILGGVGPAEFITLFSKVSYVCTDSFHGTVFSILFKREFKTFKRFKDNDSKSQNSRIINLLENLSLIDHLGNKSNSQEIIDWIKVYSLLEGLRKESIEFLSKSLCEASSTVENTKYEITNTCCGCGVCSLVCNSDAITINKINGFFQATVNLEKCIKCGACKRVCSFNGDIGTKLDDAKLYESKSCSLDVLKNSTSGGIAYEILAESINNAKSVYGCAYDYENNEARHIMVTNNEYNDLKKFQGSKYLQSDFISNVQSVLESSQGVIIGTPCQIAGIDNYLKFMKKRDKFILIDLICHGVPSYSLWEKYLNEQGMLNTLKKVKFRNKDVGWKTKEIYLSDGIKEVRKKELWDLFYNYFNLQICFMMSCYECNYRESSKADLRLGDYWGKKYTLDDLENGVSMIAAFTKCGEDILYDLKNKNRIKLEEKPMSDYYSGQCPQNHIIPVFYEKVLKELPDKSNDLIKIRSKYFRIKYYNKILQVLAAKIKRR